MKQTFKMIIEKKRYFFVLLVFYLYIESCESKCEVTPQMKLEEAHQKHIDCLKQSCSDMKNALKFVGKYYMTFYENDDYKTLPKDVFIKLLKSNDIMVSNEEVIFCSIKNWMDQNGNKTATMVQLIKTLNLKNLSLKFIMTDVKPRINMCMECRAVVIKCGIKWHVLGKSDCPNILRNYTNEKEVKIDDMILYNPIYNTAISKRLNITKKFYGVGFYNRTLIIVGGRIDMKINTSVETYDFSTKIKSKYPDMTEKKINFGVSSQKNALYIIGGHDGNKSLNTVLRLDLIEKTWSTVNHMTYPRECCAIANLDDKIYVVGGSAKYKSTNYMEMYDPTKNEWIVKSPSTTFKSCGSFVATPEYLYYVGGYDENNKNTNVAERYDPKLDKWEAIADTKISGKLNAIYYENKVIIIGNQNVQVYDEIKYNWSEVQNFNIYFKNKLTEVNFN